MILGYHLIHVLKLQVQVVEIFSHLFLDLIYIFVQSEVFLL